ncbi:protein of unknown function (plasmid) [Cupriavidus taiwanensis]|uniref:Uncharacterized protein n=1 Tax=Cupriavidus taiwanensis TaxID=164546 RepID=A0A9Q7V1B0_9BURK|nr:protein of unknown function [Cupriavidus taiwanensis]
MLKALVTLAWRRRVNRTGLAT